MSGPILIHVWRAKHPHFYPFLPMIYIPAISPSYPHKSPFFLRAHRSAICASASPESADLRRSSVPGRRSFGAISGTFQESSSGPQPGGSKIGYLSGCYQFINPQFSNVLYVYQFCLWFLQELCTTIYHVFSCFNRVFIKFLENWHFNQVFIDSLAKHAISSIIHCLSIQNWWKSAVFLGVHHFCCWTLRLKNWWISRKLI